MAGLTNEGFEVKRLADIQADINARLADIVDPNTGEFPFQNASDDSILQQIVGVFSEQCAEVWNAAQSAYFQFDPLYNTGAGQSGTVQLNGILRKAGSAAIIEMQFTGIENTVIPQGSTISDGKEQIFTTDQSVIIVGGVATVSATRTIKSAEEIADNTITTILTPISGWTGATNTATISEGTEEETDEQLRRRQQQSTALTSYRLIEAIYSAVRSIEGVTYARAYQNSKEFPQDSRGIPFKEVAVVAVGGSDDEIANALFYRFPTGQIGYGSTSVEILDEQGIINAISFSRPIEVPIFVKVGVDVTNINDFPDNYEELIKAAIIEYVEFGGKGNVDGFPPGSDILRTRLYTPINEISGFAVSTLEIGKSSATLQNADIQIEWNEVGLFLEENIVVVREG